MSKGWYGERHKHALASKGIKTASGYSKYAPLGKRGETEEYPNGILNKNGTIGNEVTDAVGGVWVTFEDINGDYVRDFWFDSELVEKGLKSSGVKYNPKYRVMKRTKSGEIDYFHTDDLEFAKQLFKEPDYDYPIKILEIWDENKQEYKVRVG